MIRTAGYVSKKKRRGLLLQSRARTLQVLSMEFDLVSRASKRFDETDGCAFQSQQLWPQQPGANSKSKSADKNLQEQGILLDVRFHAARKCRERHECFCAP